MAQVTPRPGTKAAPANWWDTFEPVPPDPYVAPTYTPTQTVKNMNGYFSGIRSGTFTTDMDSDWVHGIILGMCIIGAIGLASMVLWPIVYTLLGKPNRCCKGGKKKSPGGGGSKLVFFLFWLLALAGLGLVTYGTISMNGSLNSAGDDVGQVADTLQNAQDLANQAAAIGKELVVTAEDIVDAAVACVNNIPLLPDVTPPDITDFTDKANEYIATLGRLANSESINDTIDQCNNVSDGINNTQAWRLPLIIAICVALLVLLLYYAVLVVRTIRKGRAHFYEGGGRSCCVRFLSFITFLILVLGWLFLATGMGGAMALGGFCMDPDANTIEATDNNDVVTFYVNCAGEDPLFGDIATAQAGVVQAVSILVPAITTLLNVPGIGLVCADLAKIEEELATFNNLAYEAVTLTTQALKEFSCRSINTLYVDGVYENGCTDTPTGLGFFLLGVLLLLAGIMIAVLVWRFIVAQAMHKVDKSANVDMFADLAPGTSQAPSATTPRGGASESDYQGTRGRSKAVSGTKAVSSTSGRGWRDLSPSG